MDPIALAAALVRCPSVTPDDAGAQDVLATALDALGFQVERIVLGEAPDGPVNNLFATIGSGGRHFAFAGHTDVVPAGPGWTVEPFAATLGDNRLIGRGVADMKGALAAMVAAAARHVARGSPGTLSFIITGDEEGPATFGTDPLLDWMLANGHRPDVCLVGEPTSVSRLGDCVKIGRRGSVNIWIEVTGVQGHVAYPQRADNPITPLIAILTELKGRLLDAGSDWFLPSNLEITDLTVGNPATNVIPAVAKARLNIRFNDHHSGESLSAWVRDVVGRHAPQAAVTIKVSGEAFLTEPGAFSALVANAIHARTGLTPELSTSGGTSDARFIRRLCPVVEFGLPGDSMHKLDEQVEVEDINRLADIYDHILDHYLNSGG